MSGAVVYTDNGIEGRERGPQSHYGQGTKKNHRGHMHDAGTITWLDLQKDASNTDQEGPAYADHGGRRSLGTSERIGGGLRDSTGATGQNFGLHQGHWDGVSGIGRRSCAVPSPPLVPVHDQNNFVSLPKNVHIMYVPPQFPFTDDEWDGDNHPTFDHDSHRLESHPRTLRKTFRPPIGPLQQYEKPQHQYELWRV